MLRVALIALSVVSIGATVARSVGDPRAGSAVGDAAPATYAVDPVHSSNVFRVKHQNVAYFYGWFEKMAGSFTLDPDTGELSAVSLTIDVGSLRTRNENRDRHLRSADFFAAQEYPQITFTSTKIEPGDDGAFRVTGDLTIRGTTRQVTAVVRVTGTGTGRNGPIAGIEAEATIDRRDFGVSYGSDDVLSGQVQIRVSLEGQAS